MKALIAVEIEQAKATMMTQGKHAYSFGALQQVFVANTGMNPYQKKDSEKNVA